MSQNKYSSAALPSILWKSTAAQIFDFAKISATYGVSGINPYMSFSLANSSQVLQERLRIDQNGNVGVGSVSPSEKLDVVGNIITSGVLKFTPSYGIGVSNGIFRFDRGGAVGPLGYNFNTNSSPGGALVIMDSGNIGIGTTTPTLKLDVNGTIGNSSGNLNLSGNGSTVTISNSGFFNYADIGTLRTINGNGMSINGTVSPHTPERLLCSNGKIKSKKDAFGFCLRIVSITEELT